MITVLQAKRKPSSGRRLLQEPAVAIDHSSTTCCAMSATIGTMFGHGQVGTMGLVRLSRAKNTVLGHEAQISQALSRQRSGSEPRWEWAIRIAPSHIATAAG